MSEETSTDQIVDAVVRVFLLGLLVYFCFQIVRPFLELLAWGAILATAVYPVYLKLLPKLGNNGGLTASLMVLVTLLLLSVPVYEMTVSFVETMQGLNERFQAGTLNVPAPGEGVKEWPIIGERVYTIWLQANTNLESVVAQYREELANLSQRAIGVMAGLGGAVGSFILSTIIAGIFLTFARPCYEYIVKVMERIVEQRGMQLIDLCTQTIRSVAQGVIGIALVQAILSAFGLIVMDVPGTAVWVVLILVLAVVQLPPMLVMLPIVIYVFSVNETIPAVLFMIYAMVVSISDTFLKPLFLGRGMEIPMPIILFGAIGGVVMMGILGLFIGAIVLAIGYTLFTNWVEEPWSESVPEAEDE
jgi:predicted PurR-regulated permease PerM